MAEINPYKAPQALVSDTLEASGSLATDPNAVDAGRSLAWLTQGWRLFRQAPLVWIALCVVGLLAFMVLAWIPIVGQLTTTLLSVFFAGGAMLGARALDRDEDLTVAHLFAGFQSHLAPLLTVGALYLAGLFLLIVLVVAVVLVSGGTALGLMRGGMDVGTAIGTIVLALMVSALVVVPLGMAIWFAPALVTLHDVPPVEAMKMSFRGCMRNWLAFLVYGVIALVLAVLASIPFMLGWLVLLPVLAGSVYAGYKDIFIQA
jgi:uncharacterized membrane protein